MKKIVILGFILLAFSLNAKTLNDIIDETVRYNNWSAAKDELDVYLRTNQNDAAAFSLYSVALSQLKDYDGAIKACRNAITLESSTEKKGEYYYNLGSYYYSSNILDVAVSMYQKSIELNSLLAQPYYMLGLIMFNRKDYNQCVNYWTSYVSLCEDSVKREKIQDAINKIKSFAEAEEKRIEQEKIAAEEAKKKRDEYLQNLKDELSDSNKESKNLSDYKISDSEDEAEFEGLD